MRRCQPALALLALATAACGVDAGASGIPASSALSHPAEVALTSPARRDVGRAVVLPVELWPWQRISVVPRVTGYVGEVRVDRGSRVAAGDVLAVVSVPDLDDQRKKDLASAEVVRATLAKAKADHRLQVVTRDRLESLLATNVVPRQDVDVAQARVLTSEADIGAAQARLAEAEKDLAAAQTWIDYATVRAPFSGVVTERAVHPGALVSSTERTLLFTLVDDSRVRAVMDVPEADSGRVVVGKTRVHVDLPSCGVSEDGAVSRSAQVLDPRTRTLRVEVDLDNRDGRRLPGMFGHASLTVEVHEGALTLPSSAVVRTSAGAFVFVARGGTARRLPIEAGLDDGTLVEVLGGVAPADQVVAEPRGLTDGAIVRTASPGDRR